jgi:Protein of unknown function (DUF3347)
MKPLKLFLLASVLSCFLISSCTKQSDTDTEKKSAGETDTAKIKPDPQIESVFANVNPAPADTSAIATEEFRGKLNEVLLEYIHMKQALAKNDSTDALMQSNQMKRALTNIKGTSLIEEKKKQWEAISEKVKKCCKDVTANEKLANQRKAFSKLTDIMTEIVKKFGFKDRIIYLLNCPDKNAGSWLVDTKAIDNPYLGKINEGEKPCAEVKEAWKFE